MRRLFALVIVTAMLPGRPQPAVATDFPGAAFSGYATGTAVHAGAVRAPSAAAALVTAEVGFSGAAVDSEGFSDSVVGEMAQTVLPDAAAGRRAHGRGRGFSTAVAGGFPGDAGGERVQSGDLAESSAPPSSGPVATETGPLVVAPVAFASVSGGEADSIFSDETCVLGQPIGFGSSEAADVRLIDRDPGSSEPSTRPLIAIGSDPAEPVPSQSTSMVYLAANGDGSFALVSETRQTFAPVTLFEGTPQEFTLELLGEWVLRAVATGRAGGAAVEYGPDHPGASTTPVVRITSGGRTTELTFEDVIGAEGVVTPANPAVDVTLARHPRRLVAASDSVDPTAPPETEPDGTRAVGGVDVARLTVVHQPGDDAPRGTEIRIGHMEAEAMVPPGGVHCRLPLVHSTSTEQVNPGDVFSWTIGTGATPDARPALACDLLGLGIVHSVRSEPGVTVAVTSVSPGGRVDDPDTAMWSDLGPHHPGDPPITLTVGAEVSHQSAPGLIASLVEGSAVLDGCSGGAGGTALLERAKLEGIVLTGVAAGEGPYVIPHLLFVTAAEATSPRK